MNIKSAGFVLLAATCSLLALSGCGSSEDDAGSRTPIASVTTLATIIAPEETPVTAPTQVPPTPTVVEPEYEVVERYEIPNGGEGKLILIPIDQLNEPYLSALGERLKEDTEGDRNAFIFIFTDRGAIEVREAVLSDTADQAQQQLYDQHFIGTYVRNINTGFHALNYCLDGFVNGSDCRTIEY